VAIAALPQWPVRPCHQQIQKNKKIAVFFLLLLLVFLHLIKQLAEPAFLEAIIILLDFVAKCVNFFFSVANLIQRHVRVCGCLWQCFNFANQSVQSQGSHSFNHHKGS
jgi:hypothetical protein